MTATAEAPLLVTGGGGFLGSAIVRLLREQGRPVRSLARHLYPQLDALGVSQYSGRRGRPGGRRGGRRRLPSGLPRGGKGRALGPLCASTIGATSGDGERHRGLPEARRAATDLHELAQRGLHGPRPGGSGRVDPLRGASRRGLSGDQGDRREAGPGQQRLATSPPSRFART